LRIAADPDQSIKTAALQGIVALDPNNDKIKDAIQNITADTTRSGAQALANGFHIFSLLDVRPLTPIFFSTDDGARIAQTSALIAKILDSCADRGVELWLSDESFPSSAAKQLQLNLANSGDRDRVIYGTDATAVWWAEGAGVQEYLKSAVSGSDISTVAKKFSVLSFNPERASAFDTQVYVLNARLGEKTEVNLEGNTKITRTDAPYGVIFTGKIMQPENKLSATWSDASGIKRTARVTKIDGSEDVRFVWKRTAELSP
jgi:hypothetical protein